MYSFLKCFTNRFLTSFLISFLTLLVAGNLMWAQAPANDDRVNATELFFDSNGKYASANAEFTTVGATADGTSFSTWNSGVDGNVWFKFKATATGKISIKVLRGYDGYGTAYYVEIGLEDSAGTKLASEGAGVSVVNNGISATGLIEDEYYFFMVDNRFSSAAGTFTVKIEDSLTYDQRSEAHLISFDANGKYSSTKEEFTTVGATGDGSIFSGWSSAPSSNVWFKFQAPPSGKVAIRALRGYDDYGTGSYIQMGLEDYDGNPVASEGAGVAIVNNGIVADGLTSGATYYLTVDTRAVGNKTGTFTLQAENYWTYDQRSEAHLISFDASGKYRSSKEEFTTVGATGDGSIFSGWASAPSSNVWFKFQAPSSGKVAIRALRGYDDYGTGSYIQMGLEDYNGNPLASEGAGVAIVNNGIVADGLTSGATYYLTVDTRAVGNKTGTFTLQAENHWTYDQRSEAHLISFDANGEYSSAKEEFTTVGATGDGSIFSGWASAPSSNVWFKFQAPPSGKVAIRALRGYDDYGTGSYIQMGLEDYDGNPVASEGAGVAIVNNGIVADGLTSGDTYYLTIDNRAVGNKTGTFTLQAENYWTYDQRSEAHLISFDANGEYSSAKEEFTTVGATGDGSIFSGWSSAPSSNVWFKFQAPSSGKVAIKALRGYDDYGTGSYIQMGLEDYDGNPVASEGSGVAMINNGVVADGLTSGATYYITVDNRAIGDKTGSFTLKAQDYWTYDQQGAPFNLPLDAGGDFESEDAQFSTVGATGDGPIFNGWPSAPSSNVWFKMNFQYNGDVTVKVKRGGDYGDGSYFQMGLIDSNGNKLASIGAGTNHALVTISAQDLVAEESYYLSVDSRNVGNTTGKFSLEVNFSSNLTCETQLWAIASGSWDNPNIWSDTEGGQPIYAIPCETTEVYIKGFDVSLNSTGIETAKRVEIIGTNANTLTRLNVQIGELNVKEEVVTSGAGAKLRNASGARIKVTGN